jgi:quercetin dioxygenase-like cupin family protein
MPARFPAQNALQKPGGIRCDCPAQGHQASPGSLIDIQWKRFRMAQINSADSSRPVERPTAYVLEIDEGDHRLLGPRRAPICLKVGPEIGSSRFAALTEHIRPGDGIPTHLHENEDELIFIHSGEARITLGEEVHMAHPGANVIIPQGVWHGLRNAHPENDLIMLAVFTPPGVDGYFRAFSTLPDEEWPGLSDRDQAELEARYGIAYRGERNAEA